MHLHKPNQLVKHSVIIISYSGPVQELLLRPCSDVTFITNEDQLAHVRGNTRPSTGLHNHICRLQNHICRCVLHTWRLLRPYMMLPRRFLLHWPATVEHMTNAAWGPALVCCCCHYSASIATLSTAAAVSTSALGPGPWRRLSRSYRNAGVRRARSRHT